MKVPAYNSRVFWVAVAGLVSFLLAGIAWDLYLYRIDPTGNRTISWSIAVMTQANPGLAFVLGLGIGATVGGLVAHIWFGQVNVETWRRMQWVRFSCLCAADGLQSSIPDIQKMTACYNAIKCIEEVFPYDEEEGSRIKAEAAMLRQHAKEAAARKQAEQDELGRLRVHARRIAEAHQGKDPDYQLSVLNDVGSMIVNMYPDLKKDVS